MATQDRAQSHSRVYHVDRECYIIYLGSANRRYRPFLRVGTSSRLPDQIKRHIGSVVISDRLTGDPSEEHDCLEKPISHHMHYVGSKDLVAAVKQFIHEKSIQAINLDASKTAIEHAGTYVVFYDDANFRLFMDGHRLFDLSEREQADQHGVTMLDRLEQIVTASAGSYRGEDLSGEGFIAIRDGSVFRFRDGILNAAQLTHEANHYLARRLVPLSLLARFSGPCDRSQMVTIAKRHIVHGTSVSFATRSKPDRDTRDFIALFKKAGLEEWTETIKDVEPGRPFVTPHAEIGFCPCTFRTVEPQSIESTDGRPWLGGAAPALISGVPYRYGELPDHSALSGSYIDPLMRLLSDRTRRKIKDSVIPTPAFLMSIAKDGSLPPSDRLATALLSWNTGMIERLTGEEEHPLPEPERDRLESLLEMAPVAVLADLMEAGDHWVCLYTVPQRFTLGRIGDNRRAIEKIDAYLARKADDDHFAEERERLLLFLKRLIEEDTIEKVQPPPRQTREQADEAADTAGESGESLGGSPAAAESSGAARQRSEKTGDGASGRAAASGRAGASERSSRRGLLIALILLIAAGVAFWLLRDTILPGGDSAGIDQATADAAATDTDASTADEDLGDGDAELVPPDGIRDPSDEELQAFADLVPDGSGLDTVFVVGDGGFSITIRDILAMVNRIAVTNGYDMIDQETPEGFDPDLIYPGSLMLMPDLDIILIERGDTLWWIAHDFLLESVMDHNRELTILRQRVDDGERPVDELRDLERRVYVESLRNELATLRNQL